VRIVAADTTREGEVFLVTELLNGETLEAAWKGHELHRLSAGAHSRTPSQPTMHVDRALPIFARILDCLAACHDHGVLHRGLKPSNVFLTEGDAIKILDFGVAQIHDALPARTVTGTALGAPAFMSPEQAMGLVTQLDGRADLFSVGAMMHALVTGHPINDERTEEESLVMAATRPVPPVSRIAPRLPDAVAGIIDQSLRWDRRLRYPNAREMRDAIAGAVRACCLN
jgi:serine/threonine protein kinase